MGFERFTLTSDQQNAVDKMLSPSCEGAALVGAELGVGKTLLASTFIIETGAKTALIIAPLQTLGQLGDDEVEPEGWLGTFQRQAPGASFRQIDSTPAGMKALADYEWGASGTFFIGQELFALWSWEKIPVMVGRAPNKTQRLDKHGKPMFRQVSTGRFSRRVDVIVYDEVHRAQSKESQTHKSLMETNAGFKIALGATPHGNSFDGAYAVTKWLWPHRAEKNIYDWRDKWAETKYDHFAVRNQRTVGEKVPGAFYGQLPCYVMIESDLDVEVEEHKVWVDLPPEQRRIYDELERQMVAWIEDNPMVVKVPIVRRTRQRQATLGMPTLRKELDKKTGKLETVVDFELGCESVKLDSLLSIMKEEIGDEPVVVFLDSAKFADVAVDRLIRAGYSARKRSGTVTKKQRIIDKQDFIAGRYQVMVAVIRATGTGLDGLQRVCRNLVYLSSDDSGIENEQSVGRLVRKGQAAEVVRIWWLLARGTIDSGQMSAQTAAAIQRNKTLRKKRGTVAPTS